jgi:hypothetical protein
MCYIWITLVPPALHIWCVIMLYAYWRKNPLDSRSVEGIFKANKLQGD